jgi:ribosomal-protein-alanine N-acetyltransferase
MPGHSPELPSQPPFLQGPRLYLRALIEADADGPYPSWFNNAEVCRGNSHHVHPYSRSAALEYIRWSCQTREALVLAIVLGEDHRHIGNIALQSIHPLYRNAELSVVLGDRTAWGYGYAREAAHLLVRHGFEALNLHRIGCGTFAENVAMQKLATALGMREEGRRRAAVFKNGQFVDVIEYGLLQNEYRELFPTP